MTRKVSCEEVLSKLHAYLDKEVDAPSEADIDAHLHKCRECFSRAEFERALKKKVSATAEITTPEDTRKRLESLVKRF
jgi:anti-sigma factor (TIGR02949 family)